MKALKTLGNEDDLEKAFEFDPRAFDNFLSMRSFDHTLSQPRVIAFELCQRTSLKF